MNKNQKGFSAVEVLLTIIALALVVFVGYYVWHNNNKDKTPATSQQSSTTIGKSTTPTSTTPSPSTLTFTNLGVKITLGNSLKTLKYTPDTQYPATVDPVSTTEYASLAQGCSASDPGNFGIVSKHTGTYDSSVDQLILLKQFSGFWVGFTPALGNPCEGTSKSQQTLDLQSSLKADIIQAFKTASLSN